MLAVPHWMWECNHAAVLYRGLSINTCIVVRHLSPDDEVIQTGGSSDANSNGDGEDQVAKRPCQKLKVIIDVVAIVKHFLV